MSLVTLDRVRVNHGARRVLDHITLTLERGEIVTVVGPNGSGKTTLMRTILGALQPVSGIVRQAPGLRIGYVPQRLHIDRTLPMSAARFLSLPRRQSATDVAAALADADLSGIETQPVAALSGGQLQRLLLARALLDDPDLLILDEPTTGLDQPGAAAFYRRIEAIRNARGLAVLMVSHDLHVVMAASDRVICLNGHICCHGAPEVVASAPEYRALFGSGTQGALALYKHQHSHSHDHDNEAHP